MITISVTQKHIDSGLADDCYSCPIALAAACALDRDVSVWGDLLCIVDECASDVAETRLPKKALVFINHFDAGLKVRPFSFRVPEVAKWKPVGGAAGLAPVIQAGGGRG